MIDVKKIDKYEFDLDNYALRVGDDASYNTYYSISINYNNESFNIGLQMPETGIPPQVILFNNHILIGAEGVYIWQPNMGKPLYYKLGAPFYEFYVVGDSIVILYEIGVIAINTNFTKKWEKSFSEIVDIERIADNILVLKNFNGKLIKLDLSTGECI
ncbi:MAG: hypothetical protein K2I75_06350 [Clostridiales bacterium]|nr:hypothetical protein [Clostridiales bacterium]